MPVFNKILIANRGEIAIRISKAAKDLGIKSLCVYSWEDRSAHHRTQADEAVLMEGDTLAETYLNAQQFIDIAKNHGADAIHPGYGFLSENMNFAQLCEENEIAFIGPSAASMAIMGDKISAREFAMNANVPLLKGITGSIEEILSKKKELVYPIIIKPAYGGGGKGMRVLHNDEHLESELQATAREAKAYFGNDAVFVERYIENPRHIEVQVLGDKQGNIVHLFERECSLQRRHQKVIEEAPSITLSDNKRTEITQSAVNLARASNYYSAGTVEFLLDENMDFFFMEMNTRIQVEHTVTEEITGIDIVKNQIEIASGKELAFRQEDIAINGHSIQFRVYAEDVSSDFRPSPGAILAHKEIKSTKKIRVDSAVPPLVHPSARPYHISASYDPMIAKVIVHDIDRPSAIQLGKQVLSKTGIAGIANNLSFLLGILNDDAYVNNEISTNYLEQARLKILDSSKLNEDDINQNILPYLQQENGAIHPWRSNNDNVSFIIEEKEYGQNVGQKNDHNTVEIIKQNNVISYAFLNGHAIKIQRSAALNRDKNYSTELSLEGSTATTSPIPGTIIDILVEKGQEVKSGQGLIIVEAMKMENTLTATLDGIIEEILVAKGDKVNAGKVLIRLADPED